MPTAYSRVTVLNGARRVDLALPSALPLTDVLPQLLTFCAPDGDPERPVSWTVGRIGGGNLALDTTLADAGVADGDVLELRAGTEPAHPAYVEDVRDVLEDAVDQTARHWQPRTTGAFAVVAGSVTLATALWLPGALTPGEVVPLVTALVIAAGLVTTGWWAAGRGHVAPAQVAVAVAALWGGAVGWLAAGFLAWPADTAVTGGADAARWALALAGAALLAAAARALTPAATAHLAALALPAGAGLVTGGIALAGFDPMAGVRLAAVGVVLVVGVLPRASLTVGGLASADYLVRNQGLISEAALARRIRDSNALLYGGILGTAAVGIVAGVLLATTGSRWDQALAVAVGTALVLRSRVFTRVLQVVPVRVAGLVVIAAHAAAWIQTTPGWQPWAVPLTALLVGGGLALSAVALSDVARARVKQLLNRAELVVVVVMVPLAAGALGLYRLIADVIPG